VNRLLESGLFDRTYYELQTGLEFRDDGQAVKHFLSANPHDAYSFHPLIEGTWIEEGLSDSAKPWHILLFESPAIESTGPLFRRGGSESGVRSETLDGTLRRYLSPPDDESPATLTTWSGQPAEWQDARESMYSVARTASMQEQRARRRNSTEWDGRAEEVFVKRVSLLDVNDASPEPRVSIILPTFNRAEVIENALQSVLRQTFASWELIVVDDGSTDSTEQLIDHWRARDGRVRLVSQAKAGVSAARNKGIELARGEYIAFLDSDNAWKPDFLRLSLLGMVESGGQVTYCAVELQTDSGHQYLGGVANRDELLDGRNLIDLNALMLHRDVLARVGNFDTGLRRWVDYDLILRILKYYDATYLPMVGVVYNHRTSSRDRITTIESPLWRDVVLEKNLVDWTRLTEESHLRIGGRVSVLIRTRREWPRTLATIRSLLDHTNGDDVEVIVIDNGSPRDESAILTAAFLGDPRVSIVRVAGDLGLPTSVNLAFATSTGDVAAVVAPGASTRPGWASQIRKDVASASDGVVPSGSNEGDGPFFAASAEAFLSRRGLDPSPRDTAVDDRLARIRPLDS
jgi:glycosyltransferase involved in cell wall biosynthesis